MNVPRPPARGAALLLALLILSLVAVVAAAMVQHQQRAIEVEAAERARTQAAWILNGAIDLARFFLRDDGRVNSFDHASDLWGNELKEARLSTFLAADKENNTDVDLDVFLSGKVVDMQSRYNLTRLAADDGKPVEPELAALRRLCEAAGLASDVAEQLGRGMVSALDGGSTDGPLRPRRLSQLTWLGLDQAAIAQLEPLVVLLPVRTPVNANTAPREVLLAAIDGIDVGVAERIVQARLRGPLKTMADLRALLPEGVNVDEGRVSVSSSYFLGLASVRFEDRVLEERVLLERRPGGGDVLVRQRERISLAAAR